MNLLDMSTKWGKSAKAEGIYEGVDRKTGEIKWTATPVDLIFGSHSNFVRSQKSILLKPGKINSCATL